MSFLSNLKRNVETTIDEIIVEKEGLKEDSDALLASIKDPNTELNPSEASTFGHLSYSFIYNNIIAGWQIVRPHDPSLFQ